MSCPKSTEQTFWMTLDLLVEREWRKKGREQGDEVQDWLDSLASRSQSIDSKLSPGSSPRKGESARSLPKSNSRRSSKAKKEEKFRKYSVGYVDAPDIGDAPDEVNEIMKPLVFDLR